MAPGVTPFAMVSAVRAYYTKTLGWIGHDHIRQPWSDAPAAIHTDSRASLAPYEAQTRKRRPPSHERDLLSAD